MVLRWTPDYPEENKWHQCQNSIKVAPIESPLSDTLKIDSALVEGY